MLLQRLVEYAASMEEAAPPFHRAQVFHWRLDLDLSGAPRSRELGPLEHPDARGKVRGITHVTPAVVRTVGVAANLAADDVQYVLGWADSSAKPARVAQCHAAFADLTGRWASSPAGRADPVAQAVAAFYRDGHVATLQQPAEFTSKQRVLITVDDAPAYQAPSVVEFWTQEVADRKGAANVGLCLVCGRVGALLDTMPGKVPASLVPGATNDASLVSINERVFGYDLSMQLRNTPLCLGCGEQIARGLHDVLQRHAATYAGQDSRLAWWVVGAPTFDLMNLMNTPQPEDVHALFDAVRTGNREPGRKLGTFCSLTLGGNVARVMVRDWVEMPLEKLEDTIAAWCEHTTIATARPGGGTQHPGFLALLSATGRWVRERGRYADLGAKGADRPANAQRDLLRAAIRGTPVPHSLLVHLVHRIATDGRLDEARAALLRLCLLRHHPAQENTPMAELQLSNTDPAYVAGRIFAELEQIQYDAAEGKVLNTTFGDRYFAGAITNPRTVLVTGCRDANAWLKKLRRPPNTGKATRHEKTLHELFALLDPEPGLPSRMNVRQQATFLLGYHHHRAAHFRAIATRKSQTTSTATDDTLKENTP